MGPTEGVLIESIVRLVSKYSNRREGPTMPSTDTTTSKRETWRDWLKDKPEPTTLYTRDEIAEMASVVDKISGNDIRHWEYQGVLPRSIRRGHDGVTRAVYPDWYAHLARMVRQLQRQGLSLADIRPRVREQAQRIIHMDLIVEPLDIPDDIEAALNVLAHRTADQAGSPVREIVVSITLEDGGGLFFSVPLHPRDSQLQLEVS